MTTPDDEREGYLRALLEAGEEVLALGPQGLITARRLLFAWRLRWPPHAGEWTHDEVTCDELTRWSEGRSHDQRPILRLEHPVHRRLGSVPGHRFLWFAGGGGPARSRSERRSFRVGSARAPLYLGLLGRLHASDVAVGELFYESVPVRAPIDFGIGRHVRFLARVMGGRESPLGLAGGSRKPID
jgi:hypothetical protein